MNENIELINKLRAFCEKYDGTSCICCPIYSSKEDCCPLLTVITRLDETEGDDIDIVFTD